MASLLLLEVLAPRAPNCDAVRRRGRRQRPRVPSEDPYKIGTLRHYIRDVMHYMKNKFPGHAAKDFFKCFTEHWQDSDEARWLHDVTAAAASTSRMLMYERKLRAKMGRAAFLCLRRRRGGPASRGAPPWL